MAISPPSDIVLDVLHAADPGAARAAARTLSRLSAGGVEGPTAFGETQAATPAWPGPRMPFDTAGARVAMRSEAGQGGPLRQFEAFVLQTFVQAMLPEDGEAVFGRGTAGSVWKSMLAEHIAGELARSGGIGIADSLAPGGGRRDG